MHIGTLCARVILDEPTKIHFGPRDPVRGHIEITYQRNPKNISAELFGPLMVFVALHGRAKTKIRRSNGQTTNIYRGRAPLVSKKLLLHDDSIKMQSGDTVRFPFSINFPEVTNALVEDRFNEASRFVCLRNQPLPPSFQTSNTALSHSRFEAFVEYRVGVDVLTPRLHVNILRPNKYQEPEVYYGCLRSSLPAFTKTREWSGAVAVSNELLLPEADRPCGFKQKTKAFFGAVNFPTYSFDWFCSGPEHIYIDEPLRFQVHIRPRASQCTAPLVPEVRLKYFRVVIRADLLVRSSQLVFRAAESARNCTTLQLPGLVDAADEPFSKANEFTKIVDTRPVGYRGIKPSFATFNIALGYAVRVDLAFEVAGKLKRFDYEYRVVVRPPLDAAAGSPAADAAGPSAPPGGAQNDVAELPRYEPVPPYETSNI